MYIEKPSLLGILYKPTLQFKRLNVRPEFGLALVINTLVSATIITLMVYVLASTNKPFLIERLKEDGLPIDYGVSQDAIVIFTFLILLIGIPLLNLIGAFSCWMFVLIFSGETTFRKMFSVNVYAGFVFVIQTAISAVAAFLIPELSETQSFFNLIFPIWKYILLGIGLKETTTLSREKVVITIFILYAIGLVLGIVFS